MLSNLKKIQRIFSKNSNPSFLIVGAQKAGTSALFSILKSHSFLVASSKKEIHYFNSDSWYFKPNSLEEYREYFQHSPFSKHNSQCFEATPAYLYPPEVPERIYNFNENMKIIILLRNPAIRALSAWAMYHFSFEKGIYNHLHDKRSFREAIEQEISDPDSEDFFISKIAYIKRGIYQPQIERYFNYFTPQNCLIIENNELLTQFDSVMKRIFEFLSIPYEKLSVKIKNKGMLSDNKPYINEIMKLKEFYKPYNHSLYNLLGRKFNWDDA